MINQVLLSFEGSFKEHREDLSAILLTSDRYLWLGSDETSTIERLSYLDDGNFAKHKHYRVRDFIELPDLDKAMEIDIEGLASDGNYLWFTGSHSYKRKKPKQTGDDKKDIRRLAKIATEPNRYVIGRIPLVDGELRKSVSASGVKLTAAKLEINKKGNALIKALESDEHLGLFIRAQIAGKDNGFDVEGLAVVGERIFLGLRGPVLRGWAIILEIEFEEFAPGLLRLRKIGENETCYKKHFVNLKGLGIRDLLRDGDDFLILAGPTMDLSGPVQIYRLRDLSNLEEGVLNKPEKARDIPFGDKFDHAEGITLFNEITGEPSVMTVYDSPAKTRLVGDDGILADVFRLKR